MKEGADSNSRQCWDESCSDGPPKAFGFLINGLERAHTWPVKQGKNSDRKKGVPVPSLVQKEKRQLSGR